MKELIIPSKLNAGDKVAFISISGGRAGDEDMLPRYLLGKRRFEKIFNVEVVETPNALKGSEYLYEHPEKRAEDLMWALKDDSIKGIICNQGGDDSYRVLPYIDTQVIHDYPKVFMGFSDIATWTAVYTYAGVRSYYGRRQKECRPPYPAALPTTMFLNHRTRREGPPNLADRDCCPCEADGCRPCSRTPAVQERQVPSPL